MNEAGIIKYFDSMKTIGKKLPALAARVFALKGTGSMVKDLGWLLLTCNSFDIDHEDIHLTSDFNIRFSYKNLINDVEFAEASIKRKQS